VWLSVCLEQGAGLHIAQLMPLPLTVSCFSKIQIGLPFWYRLTWVVLDKGPLNGVCVCVFMYYHNALLDRPQLFYTLRLQIIRWSDEREQTLQPVLLNILYIYVYSMLPFCLSYVQFGMFWGK